MPEAKTRQPTVILHAGAPKTGSTSLQHFFYDNADALRELGAVCPERLIGRGQVDPLHNVLVALRKGRAEERVLARGRARLEELFAEDGVHTVIVSNESMLGEPFLRDKPGFFPDAKVALPMLERLFEGYRVEVVFFVRDFVSYIPSYYVQEVRRGLAWSLDRYAAALGGKTLSWKPVIEKLGKSFGADHVRIFNYDTLLAAPEKTVVDAFGRLIPGLPVFGGGEYRKNRSIGGPVLGLYRAFNTLFFRLIPVRYHREGHRKLRRYVFDPLAVFARGGKPMLSAVHANALEDAFERDRKALGL